MSIEQRQLNKTGGAKNQRHVANNHLMSNVTARNKCAFARRTTQDDQVTPNRTFSPLD